MSDRRNWGTIEDVNNQSSGELTLDDFSPRSQIDPPLPYEVCVVCGFIYRRDDMVKYKQSWYCKPQTCFRDIVGMEMKNNPEDTFKNRALAQRFWKGSGGQRS